MFGIIKKDIKYAILYQLPLMTLIITYLFIKRQSIDATFMALMGSFTFLIVISSVMISESNEERSKGYIFLSTLPLSSAAIVLGKFVLTLVIDLILVTLSLVLISTSPGTVLFKSVGEAFLILVGTAALIAAALLYIGSFRFGFTKTMRGATLLILVLVVAVPAVIREMLWPMMGSNVSYILDMVKDFNWFIVGLMGLIIYTGLMVIAVKVKSASSPESYT